MNTGNRVLALRGHEGARSACRSGRAGDLKRNSTHRHGACSARAAICRLAPEPRARPPARANRARAGARASTSAPSSPTACARQLSASQEFRFTQLFFFYYYSLFFFSHNARGAVQSPDEGPVLVLGARVSVLSGYFRARAVKRCLHTHART